MTDKIYCDSVKPCPVKLRIEVKDMSRDPIAMGIRYLITERGMIQKVVAQRAGYTSQQFSDMLNDRKVIKAVDVLPISKALGVSVQDIYDAGKLYQGEVQV